MGDDYLPGTALSTSHLILKMALCYEFKTNLILWMRGLKDRNVKNLAHHHTGGKWRSQNSEAANQASVGTFITTVSNCLSDYRKCLNSSSVLMAYNLL